MPKIKITLSLNDTLVAAARKQLDKPPKKSLSAWIEEKIYQEFVKQSK